MKTPTCTFSYGGYARHTMCKSVFSVIPQGNEKNQQSILKYKILNRKQHQVDPVKETVDVKRCVLKFL